MASSLISTPLQTGDRPAPVVDPLRELRHETDPISPDAVTHKWAKPWVCTGLGSCCSAGVTRRVNERTTGDFSK